MNTPHLTTMDIVVYALYRLGGWEKRVHTEDVALECFKIAPSRFSWVKYTQYPDLTPTRYALEDLKKSRSTLGALVQGESERKSASGTGGWRLTALGMAWVKTNQDRVERALQVNIAPTERLQGEKKLKTLIKSPAFAKFQSSGGDEISHAELAESLLATINTSPKVLHERISQLQAVAIELKHSQALEYLDFVQDKLLTIMDER